MPDGPDLNDLKYEDLPQFHRADRICDAYEQAWLEGQEPQLEDYVAQAPDAERANLERELKTIRSHYERGTPQSREIPALGDSFGGATDDTASTALPGLKQLGDYRILREVGRGGMGIVYEAEQLSLGRRVALKVLPQQMLLDNKHKRRFEREAKAAARLHHTNIVPVFGVGEQDGVHYYVMQFIQGLGLDEVIGELQRLKQTQHSAQAASGSQSGSDADCSARRVARSLMTGEFERTVISNRDSRFDDPGATAAGAVRHAGESVSDSRRSGDRPACVAQVDQSGDGVLEVSTTVGGPSDSPPANLSDSFNLSGTIPLSGQSDPSSSTSSRARRKQSFWTSVAHIGRQVASALQYAHEAGITHRDIKPSNLLLDMRGTVWVTDFGLAKASDQQDLTHTGDILGTLRYMPPEAFEGKSGPSGDLYSVGLTLYELLAQRPAFEEKDRHKLIKLVTTGQPQRIETLNPDVPRDLATIIHKSIDRDPSHRYASARDLADDLQRFLDDEPIRARRISTAERTWRWCRRNPLPASLAAGIALVVVVGFAGVFWQWGRAEVARVDEQIQRENAVRARDEAIAQEATARSQKERAEREMARAQAAEVKTAAALYSSNIVRAQLQYRANNVVNTEDILDRCRVERRGCEWHFLKQLCHTDLLTLPGHTSWVNAVAYSPDGKLLASAGGGNPFWESQGAASIRPGEVILWDATTGARLRTLQGHDNVILALAFGPNGKQLATGSQDDTVRLWDPDSGKLLRVLPGQSQTRADWGQGVSSVAFSPDGKLLAVGTTNKVDLWDLTRPDADATPSRTLPGPDGHRALGLAFSPDGERLVVAYQKRWVGQVKVWDITRGVEALTLEANRGFVRGIAMSPDGRYLASWEDPRGLKFWDPATGKLLRTLSGQNSDFFAGAFSPTGEEFAAGSNDGVIRIWSMAAGREIRLYRGHHGRVRGVAFSADGQCLASASADGTVKVWDLTRDPEHGLIPTGTEQFEIEAVAFADQGKRLVAAQRGGGIQDLDCDTQARWRELSNVGLTRHWLTPAEPARLNAEGRWLAGISREDPRVAMCWEAATGQERAVLRGHQQALWFVTINADGTRIATAGRSAGGEVPHSEFKVWNVAEERPLFQIDEPSFQVTRLALSPDGDRLALTGLRFTPGEKERGFVIEAMLRVYEVESAEVMREFVLSSTRADEYEPLLALAFSANGNRLAAAGTGRTVLLWDLAAEQPLVTRQGPEGAMDLAFSPDDRRLAVASRLEIKLLDAASGDEMLTLLGRQQLHPDTNGFNPRVRFSPDSRQLVAICHDRNMPLALWSLDREANWDPAARLRAAGRRATATHLALAHEWANNPERRAEFLFHLQHLQGIELTTAEEYVVRGAVYLSAGRLDEAEADFARAVQLAPDDSPTLYEVGEAFAAAGLWDQAAHNFDQYVALGPGRRGLFRFEVAVLPLYRHDPATYRRYARRFLERHGQSRNPAVLSSLLVFGLLVGENDTDPQQLLRLADRCLGASDQQQPSAFQVEAKAMAEYRAGQMEKAVEWLRKADAMATANYHRACIVFFLSMAYQRLDRGDEAEAAYQQGLQYLEKAFGSPDNFQPGKMVWYVWGLSQVVRREAEAVLNKDQGPDETQ